MSVARALSVRWMNGASVFTAAAKAGVLCSSFRRPKGLLHPVTADGCSGSDEPEGPFHPVTADGCSGSDEPKGLLPPVSEGCSGFAEPEGLLDLPRDGGFLEDAKAWVEERPFRAASGALRIWGFSPGASSCSRNQALLKVDATGRRNSNSAPCVCRSLAASIIVGRFKR